MKTKNLLFVLLIFVGASFLSCSKDDSGDGGTTINYVVKATYDNPQDHDGRIDAEVTNLALTTPSGGNSVSLNSLTPLSIGKDWGPYPAGMTVRVTAESVLTHVTVTVEIWKNGVLWKEQTAMGTDAYVVATATGVI
ncbi:MAG: hypothetical protein K9H49_00640 [Bacteroidales bacterium]|nr:hypothetical protein [Bacteroidales bacterium]MCF8389862.1 hypothetical protein [Bacteroidales bacterium]